MGLMPALLNDGLVLKKYVYSGLFDFSLLKLVHIQKSS